MSTSYIDKKIKDIFLRAGLNPDEDETAAQMVSEILLSFQSTLEEAIERTRSELRIGDLRQWLNEDRITDSKKMVTNEQIKVMLGLDSLNEEGGVCKKEEELHSKSSESVMITGECLCHCQKEEVGR